VRWIAGAYLISPNRFISTGNVFDLGTGEVPEVRREPLPLFNPQFTYLADSQDNFAWAGFGNIDVNLTDKLELSTSLRYDRDDRKNTTETPAEFIPAPLVGIAFRGRFVRTPGTIGSRKSRCATSRQAIPRCISVTAAASAAAASIKRVSVQRASPG